MAISGAGTSEGYVGPGQHRYECPHGHTSKVGHKSWLWWCPLCPKTAPPVIGPNASHKAVIDGTLAYPPNMKRSAVARHSRRGWKCDFTPPFGEGFV